MKKCGNMNEFAFAIKSDGHDRWSMDFAAGGVQMVHVENEDWNAIEALLHELSSLEFKADKDGKITME